MTGQHRGPGNNDPNWKSLHNKKLPLKMVSPFTTQWPLFLQLRMKEERVVRFGLVEFQVAEKFCALSF